MICSKLKKEFQLQMFPIVSEQHDAKITTATFASNNIEILMFVIYIIDIATPLE